MDVLNNSDDDHDDDYDDDDDDDDYDDDHDDDGYDDDCGDGDDYDDGGCDDDYEDFNYSFWNHLITLYYVYSALELIICTNTRTHTHSTGFRQSCPSLSTLQCHYLSSQ